MRKLSLQFALGVLAPLSLSLEAFDYKLSGFANQAATIGFNQEQVNRSKGLYPMQQYATIAGYLALDFNLLPKTAVGHSLKGSIGGMVAGVLYDGTKHFQGGSVVYQNFGYYDGFLGGGADVLQSDSITTKNRKMTNYAHDYIFSDAYLEYDYKNFFGIKAGRYRSFAPYKSGQTEGFEVYGQFKHVRLWWFSSWGRAFSTGARVRDWYAARVSYSGGYYQNSNGGWSPRGHKVAYGTHAVQLTYKKHHLLAEGFFYFSPKMFNAPGLRIGWDSNPNFQGLGFRSNTEITAFFPIYYPWMVVGANGAHIYRYDNPATPNGQSLIIRQRFDFNQFFILGTFYKNFRNVNAYVGNTGNPAGVELYSNSLWAGYAGTALKADAITGSLVYGGTHFKKKFTWRMTWQWSSAPVSYEGRVVFSVIYQVTPWLKMLVDLAYYGLHTNKGYQAGLNGPCNPQKTYCGGNYQDRSALYTQLIASF
ncbi:outer membrane family protein [Helicobacter bizzozeronii]|uniref:OMP684 n=1 Tax=Helicobacter bizzozeronii TaxID=56877 RepID=A0A1M4NHA9_HELBI|nr:outer membrane family protein [Helicobacter bizzozeronii]SFZ71880.1 OMP684 [Helicobacter bizzozeronii]